MEVKSYIIQGSFSVENSQKNPLHINSNPSGKHTNSRWNGHIRACSIQLSSMNTKLFPPWWKGERKREVIQPATKKQNSVQIDINLFKPAGEGKRLPESVKAVMEDLFIEDFSEVRIHTSPKAKTIGAQAYTIGNNIYFAPGKYQPHTKNGIRLLANELTHVIQQKEGRVINPFGKGNVLIRDPKLDEEAFRVSEDIAAMFFSARRGFSGKRYYNSNKIVQKSDFEDLLREIDSMDPGKERQEYRFELLKSLEKITNAKQLKKARLIAMGGKSEKQDCGVIWKAHYKQYGEVNIEYYYYDIQGSGVMGRFISLGKGNDKPMRSAKSVFGSNHVHAEMSGLFNQMILKNGFAFIGEPQQFDWGVEFDGWNNIVSGDSVIVSKRCCSKCRDVLEYFKVTITDDNPDGESGSPPSSGEWTNPIPCGLKNHFNREIDHDSVPVHVREWSKKIDEIAGNAK